MAKRVLVTGASSGIGRALALCLARDGAQVAVCARRAEALADLCDEGRGTQGRIVGRSCDIRDRSSIEDFVSWATSELGGLDVLVNNAGALGPRNPIREISVEEFDDVIQTNVVGLFAMTKAALPALCQEGAGLVINISSGLGRFGVANSSAYCASKFAVEGFTQSLADEYAGSELVAVALSPGMVATGMLQNYLGEEDVSAYLDPNDVAAGISRLIEDATPAYNGRALDIDEFLVAE